MVTAGKRQAYPGFWIGRVCVTSSLFVAVPLGAFLQFRGSLPSTHSQVERAKAAAQFESSSAHSVDVDLHHNSISLNASHVFGQQGQSRSDAVSTLNSAARSLDNSTGVALQNETDEDLERMRTLLLKPSTRPYKFYGYNVKGRLPYPSQSGQDHWVDMFLGQRRDLFVVESGAFDGEEGSNSLFFETRRNWTCLLVEANPVLQRAIKGKHRKCHLLLGGLSTTDRMGSFMFKLVGGLGGLVDFLGKDAHTAGRVRSHADGKRGSPKSGEEVNVSCFPLTSVLEEIGERVVDYWSLDTEGSEAEILRHTDFNKIEVGLISVEHNRQEKIRRDIKQILWHKGFWRVAELDQDDMYANPCYFVKRRLHFPSPGTDFPPASTWKGGKKRDINEQDLKDFQQHIVSPSALADQVRENEFKVEGHAWVRWVDATLGKRTGLFVIESSMSKLSSLTWFATERKWDCLVVVGSGSGDVAIQGTPQHCYSLRGKLSLSENSTIGMYPVHLILRGMNREVVDCLFLNSGADTFSIVTKSFDFSQTEIGVLSVTLADIGLRSKVKKAMEQNGFKQVQSVKTIDFYANPCYFMKRNLTFPKVKEMS